MDSKITESDIDFAFNVDGHQRRLIKKLLLRVETLEKQVNFVDLTDVGGNELELCDYCDKRPVEHCICEDCLRDPNFHSA